jgi:hypothetical protein
MEKIDSIERLNQAIAYWEKKQALDKALMREEFITTYKNFTPANLIKSTFNQLSHSDDFKDDMLDTAIGLATGYLSKKVAIGDTQNPVKQLLGVVLQMAVTNLVTNNTQSIKAMLMALINKFGSKKEGLS